MTTIVALRQDGQTWIGSDSRVSGNDIIPTRALKWHFGNYEGAELAIANSGSGALFCALRDNAPALLSAGRDGLRAQLRSLFTAEGFQPKHENSVPDFGSYMLLADNRGVLFIDTAMATWPIEEGILYAIGSGSDFAQGAGAALRGSPQRRVIAALNAAALFDTGTGGPMFVHRLGDHRDLGQAA